ncbi:MAG: hypothetical protein AAGH60_08645 [Pseudomonadota bacterium]
MTAGEEEQLLLDAEQKRWSERPIERAEAAAIYGCIATHQYELGSYESAAYGFHYAGHAFRTVWMDAKAATSYIYSANAGKAFVAGLDRATQLAIAKRQMRFDLRSLGRAVVACRASGQFDNAEDAMKRWEKLKADLDVIVRENSVEG